MSSLLTNSVISVIVVVALSESYYIFSHCKMAAVVWRTIRKLVILYIQRSSDWDVTGPVGIHYDSDRTPQQGGQSNHTVNV
jgi:hypothetical protein